MTKETIDTKDAVGREWKVEITRTNNELRFKDNDCKGDILFIRLPDKKDVSVFMYPAYKVTEYYGYDLTGDLVAILKDWLNEVQ
jgi:hypothetical protein